MMMMMMMMILTHSGREHPFKTFILNEMTVLWESCHRVFLWAGRLQASRVTSFGAYNILRVQWASKRRGGQSCWLVPGSTRTCELSKDICLLWVRILICHWFGELLGTNPFYPYLLCSTLKSDFGKSHSLTVFFSFSSWLGKNSSYGSQWFCFDAEVTHWVLCKSANLHPKHFWIL